MDVGTCTELSFRSVDDSDLGFAKLVFLMACSPSMSVLLCQLQVLLAGMGPTHAARSFECALRH
jgi:hypothetical protein